jgi:hypothetical protein
MVVKSQFHAPAPLTPGKSIPPILTVYEVRYVLEPSTTDLAGRRASKARMKLGPPLTYIQALVHISDF